MEDSLLTKCPHCKTLFRIKYEHLAVADGEVRCGVCFKVFNASDQGLSYSEGSGSDADTTFGREITPPVSAEQDANTETNATQPQELKESSDLANEPVLDDPQASTDDAVPGDIPSAEQLADLHIAEESIETQLLAAETAQSHRPLLWSGLACLTAILLTLQFLWFNSERYAYHPKLHAWYDTACRALGCSLPVYRDIKQLKSERLEIRSHPEYQNVLLIDMIVSNSGIAPQSLPEISMSFFDINGVAIAHRIFNHHDYLNGIANPISALPNDKPIQISFAILDPGEQAVNYAVEFN